MTMPFSGLRVLELSGGIAGPYAGKILVAAGTDVVKVEPPGGDPLRSWSSSGAAVDPVRGGALFQYLNAGKHAVVRDAGSAAGRTDIDDLVATADVVIDTPEPATHPDLDLRYADVAARNPGVTLVSISPFGREGPWVGRAVTEFTLQAWAGSTGHRGDPAREPLYLAGRNGEWVAGLVGALSLLASRRRTEMTGRGEHLDVSMLEAIVWTHLIDPGLYLSIAGYPYRTVRSLRFPSIVPTKDGMVGLSTLTGQHWADLCVLVERPDWLDDESLYRIDVRGRRCEELYDGLTAWTLQRTTAEVIEAAALLRIPVTPVGNGETLLAMDHLVEREAFVRNPGGFVQPAVPYRLGALARQPVCPAPALVGSDDAAVRRWKRPPAPTPPTVAAGQPLPFDGLRVIEVCSWWAGPLVGQFLAALGADVVRIESIQRLDGMRLHSTRAFTEQDWWEWTPMFHVPNAGKRDVTLNLGCDEGRSLLTRMVAGADVVLDNFAPRVLDQLGLGYDVLRAVRPDLVMMRMPAFGLSGPWRDRPGFNATIEQASGLAWVTGYADGDPMVPDTPGDTLAGLHAAVGLLVALEHRRRTGEGQLVEAPMIGGALAVTAEQVVEWSAYGALLGRDGNHAPYAAPQNVYLCADAGDDGRRDTWVAISVETDAHWQALVQALGRPSWATAAVLGCHPGRKAAEAEIDRQLTAWCAGQRVDAVVERLWPAGVPVAPVALPHDYVRNPQLRARGFLEPLDHPVVGTHERIGWPVRFSAGPARWSRTPVPTLGQHNDEVLGDLGLGAEEIDRLRADGVIGEAPASFGKNW